MHKYVALFWLVEHLLKLGIVHYLTLETLGDFRSFVPDLLVVWHYWFENFLPPELTHIELETHVLVVLIAEIAFTEFFMIEKSTLEKVEYSRSLATVLGLATTLDFEHDGKELVKLDFPRPIQVNG